MQQKVEREVMCLQVKDTRDCQQLSRCRGEASNRYCLGALGKNGPHLDLDCYLVAQSCPTLCHPMDYSPPGSSVRGIFQARILEWVGHFLLQGIFLTQGWNPWLLH